ncbi:MAG: hypothetical protein ABUS48_04985 [Pseudomonadota bacterium]
MNTRWAALLMLATMLGASCSPQPAATATQAPADSAAQATPAPVPAAAQPAVASHAAASIAGEYEGEFDGATAAVTISGSAPRYSVHLIIGADGCAGGALGPARADGAGVLTVKPADDAACTITMTPKAGGYTVAESGCQNLHGDACAFSGELHRAH